MVVFATDWRACSNPDTVCLAQRRHRASVHGFTVAAVYDVFYWISAWHFLYRLACSFFSLTSKQDAGKYEVTDIYQGEGTHALARKLRLIYSCNVRKRLRQFDQVAPWIAEKREPKRETGRVPRFADNPHITAFQFTDRGIDILDAQAQMVPSGDRMGIDQMVVRGTRRAAGTGDQLDAKTVVRRR